MATINIRPLFDNVLIEPMEAEEKTASGIYMPDSVKDKPQMGIIRAVGPGNVDEKGKEVKMIVKVGQKVMYKKWGGNEIKVGNIFSAWSQCSNNCLCQDINTFLQCLSGIIGKFDLFSHKSS
jgi:chaperonin GroES